MDILDFDFSTVTKDMPEFDSIVDELLNVVKLHFSEDCPFPPTAANNFDIMYALIQNFSKAYRVCSKSLQQNDEIILLSVKRSPHALLSLVRTHYSIEYLDLWKKILSINDISYSFIPDIIKKSPDFFQYVCDNEPFKFLPIYLNNDNFTFEQAKLLAVCRLNFTSITNKFNSESQILELLNINPQGYKHLKEEHLHNPKFYTIGFQNELAINYNKDIIGNYIFDDFFYSTEFLLFIEDKISLEKDFPDLYSHLVNVKREIELKEQIVLAKNNSENNESADKKRKI